MAAKDYDVGYGKPPKHTQFKPGQSGNPKGRPKGVRNLATDLEEELSELVMVTEGGVQQTTTKQRAMVKSLISKALKGDARTAGIVLQLIASLESSLAESAAESDMDEDDRAVLERFRAELLSEATREGGMADE